MYERQYITFLYTFNVLRDYYVCHDLLEDLWLEEGREPFYQGLLQVAVSCYHAANGNRAGAIKLMRSAILKLSWYPDRWLGIRVDKVIQDTSVYLRAWEDGLDMIPSTIQIEIFDVKLKKLVEQVEFP
jgi:predicted metal-dependent hydrolase